MRISVFIPSHRMPKDWVYFQLLLQTPMAMREAAIQQLHLTVGWSHSMVSTLPRQMQAWEVTKASLKSRRQLSLERPQIRVGRRSKMWTLLVAIRKAWRQSSLLRMVRTRSKPMLSKSRSINRERNLLHLSKWWRKCSLHFKPRKRRLREHRFIKEKTSQVLFHKQSSQRSK